MVNADQVGAGACACALAHNFLQTPAKEPCFGLRQLIQVLIRILFRDQRFVDWYLGSYAALARRLFGEAVFGDRQVRLNHWKCQWGAGLACNF